MARYLLVILSLAFLGTRAQGASAQTSEAQESPQIQRARQVFERADTAYAEGNYALALRGFEQTYELMEGHPNQHHVLYNIGLCQQHLGAETEAIASFQAFLDQGGSESEMAGDAVRRISDLRERRRMMRGAFDEPLLGAGIGTSALGVLALVASLVTGLMAHDAYQDLEMRCGPDSVCPPGSGSDISSGETLAVVSTVLLPIGVVAAGVGVTLFVLSFSAESDEPVASLRLTPSGVLFAGAF